VTYDLAFVGAVTVSVFAIVDPFGALPFFVALTSGFPEPDRRFVRDRAVLVLVALLAAFAVFGRFLFAAFGFTLQAFEIAGGILLFIVGYQMLQGEIARTKLTEEDRTEALARREEISIVPLGIPLLAGPGAISTVMIYEGTAGSDPVALLATFFAIAVSGAATWVTFRYGARILEAMGRAGVMALSRVLGLILAAIGVQFVVTGVFALLALHGY
jgi:multiple antibiotic resistance protein